MTQTSSAPSASSRSTWSSTTSRAPGWTRSSRPCGPAGATSRRAPSPVPVVGFDKRTFYLRDLTLIGCTAWDEPVFPALIGLLERGELRPPVAATWPLERIAEAQAAFLEKRHVGKYVLVPPAAEA